MILAAARELACSSAAVIVDVNGRGGRGAGELAVAPLHVVILTGRAASGVRVSAVDAIAVVRPFEVVRDEVETTGAGNEMKTTVKRTAADKIADRVEAYEESLGNNARLTSARVKAFEFTLNHPYLASAAKYTAFAGLVAAAAKAYSVLSSKAVVAEEDEVSAPVARVAKAGTFPGATN